MRRRHGAPGAKGGAASAVARQARRQRWHGRLGVSGGIGRGIWLWRRLRSVRGPHGSAGRRGGGGPRRLRRRGTTKYHRARVDRSFRRVGRLFRVRTLVLARGARAVGAATGRADAGLLLRVSECGVGGVPPGRPDRYSGSAGGISAVLRRRCRRPAFCLVPADLSVGRSDRAGVRRLRRSLAAGGAGRVGLRHDHLT